MQDENAEQEKIVFKNLVEASTGETITLEIPEELPIEDIEFLREKGMIEKVVPKKDYKKIFLHKVKNLLKYFTTSYWVDAFIERATKGAICQNLINSNKKTNALRYNIFMVDEFWDKRLGLVNQLPWWCPCNFLLHNWVDGDRGYLHDHPRWSITIVLKGRVIEETPKKYKWLGAGSIVFRSRKFIHRIIVPEAYANKTWTLFIVGRRRYKQSYYNTIGERIEGYPEPFPINDKVILGDDE